MVTYGNASGAVPPFSPLELARRGSLFLTRPLLFHYIAKRADLARGAAELFGVMASGAVKVVITSYSIHYTKLYDGIRRLTNRGHIGCSLFQ